MFKFLKNLFSNAKYTVFKSDKNGEFYFNLTAKNGEVILTSEGYKTKDGALNGITSVMLNGKDSSNFEIKKSSNGKSYFILKAPNNKVIGISELYENQSGSNSGIESVMKSCDTDIIKFD